MILDLVEVKKILGDLDLSDEELQALVSKIEEIAFGVVHCLFQEGDDE